MAYNTTPSPTTMTAVRQLIEGENTEMEQAVSAFEQRQPHVARQHVILAVLALLGQRSRVERA